MSKSSDPLKDVLAPLGKEVELPMVTKEWKETEYAVYHYIPNQETLEKKDTESRTAGSGFSLTLVSSSICADREHLLREHVGVKMSLGTLYKNSGLVASMDPDIFPPPSQCYISKVDSSKEGAGDRHFLICFVCIGKQGLDLFRNELDVFCSSLSPLLKNLPDDNPGKSFNGSALEGRLKSWYTDNVEYLVQVVQLCKEELPVLLHVAVDSPVKVLGDDPRLVKYLQMFLEACSLSNLMQLSPTQEDKKQDPLVNIEVSEKSCKISSNVSSKFCQNWAQVLLLQGTNSPDPFFLKQALENYKLKIIQDINTLKRLLRQAESNYHALYRCYAFLCACGNGDLLLQCSIQEAMTLEAPETLAVLDTLQTFAQTNPFQS